MLREKSEGAGESVSRLGKPRASWAGRSYERGWGGWGAAPGLRRRPGLQPGQSWGTHGPSWSPLCLPRPCRSAFSPAGSLHQGGLPALGCPGDHHAPPRHPLPGGQCQESAAPAPGLRQGQEQPVQALELHPGEPSTDRQGRRPGAGEDATGFPRKGSNRIQPKVSQLKARR